MDKSNSIKELATALAKAQAEVGNAKKDSDNPFFKSKYADLATIMDVVRPVFTKNGLSFVQMPGHDGEMLTVTTMLLHSSGEYISEVAKVRPVKPDPQAAGSAITYLRRYALAAFAGVAQEDDDGNAASKSDKPTSGARQSTPKAVSNIVFKYALWTLEETKKDSAEKYAQEQGAQFDDDSGHWLSQRPLKRLEAYQVEEGA